MFTIDQLSLKPEDPQLVVSEAKENRGLDLLGLRAPAEAVANRLLNGVTTVTPAIRYLTIGLRAFAKLLGPTVGSAHSKLLTSGSDGASRMTISQKFW
jgi:hypothetical protein